MKLTSIILVAMLSCAAKQQQEVPSYENKVFYSTPNDKYLQNFVPVDFDNDQVPDAILGQYDLNGNGIHDTDALYKINSINSFENTYTSSDKALVLMVHDEKTGGVSYMLYDIDKNGSLETKKMIESDTLDYKIKKI